MKKRYYFYFIYLLLVSLVVSEIAFSRYSTTVESSSQVTVAQPVVEYIPTGLTFNGLPLESFNEGISLSDVMPGDVLVYEFDIKNYEEEKQNQVLMKYLITVVFDPEVSVLPLTYTLEPAGTYPSAGGEWVYLGFGSRIIHSYTLTVSWDENEDNPEYYNQEQGIRIQIDAQQTNSMA